MDGGVSLAGGFVVELAEEAGLGEEFLGGAGLFDDAVVEDVEVVAEAGLPDDVVIDDDDGAACEGAAHGFDEGEFFHGAHAGGGLVEEEDGGFAEEAAGECEEFFLAAGEACACGERLVEGVGADGFGEDLVEAGELGGGEDFLVGGVGAGDAHVFADGVVEEGRELRHEDEVASDGGDGKVAERSAA